MKINLNPNWTVEVKSLIRRFFIVKTAIKFYQQFKLIKKQLILKALIVTNTFYRAETKKNDNFILPLPAWILLWDSEWMCAVQQLAWNWFLNLNDIHC